MASYTKEIKITTPNVDYTKRITGAYNVIFDKIIKVDNSNAGIDLDIRCPLTGEYIIGNNWKETH